MHELRPFVVIRESASDTRQKLPFVLRSTALRGDDQDLKIVRD
jgi:hypothetical protein